MKGFEGLVLGTVLLWLHGGWLLTSGYVTRERSILPDRTIERAWFTPLTGLRRETRVRKAAPENARPVPDAK